MHRTSVLLSILLLIAALNSDLRAGTLAGVALPDTAQAGNKVLLLNGVGLRTKIFVKVYVAGLYVEQKSSDASAILKVEVPKRVVMHFVRGVSKNQITDGFKESFENNTPDATKTLKAEIDRFLGALESVNDGDEVVITYLPGTGTTLTIKGNERVTISAPAFASVIFSVWLGPKPPNADLKKGLLGL